MSLKSTYDSKHFREAGHALIDLLADHLRRVQSSKGEKVMAWQEPNEELNFWRKYSAESNSDPADFFKTVLERSIHLHHPNYMGHQIAAPAPISALAGLLSGFLNNGMAVYEMGAAATALERVVIETISEALGYGEMSSGLLTSGGTLANLTALLTARATIAKTAIWEHGHSDEKLAIMVSEQAHYCVDRAARIMGLGSEGIIKIPVNDQFQIEVQSLASLYQEATTAGKKVIAIVGSACTTATGSYDDLESIGQFASRHNIWFHVDGAHGGAACFSAKYKSLVKGIATADSVVIDCHKMLMTTSVTTALLYKNGVDSYKTFNQQATYLWADQETEEWYNLGKRTFECTKLMLSIQFYSILHTQGIKVFDDFVTTLYDLATAFAQNILEREDFDLLITSQSNIVCFRWHPPSQSIPQVSSWNAMIRRSLLEEGDYYIVQTTIEKEVWLRTTIMNPFTTTSILDKLLDLIATKGQTFLEKIPTD